MKVPLRHAPRAAPARRRSAARRARRHRPDRARQARQSPSGRLRLLRLGRRRHRHPVDDVRVLRRPRHARAPVREHEDVDRLDPRAGTRRAAAAGACGPAASTTPIGWRWTNPVQGSSFGGTDPYYIASAYYYNAARTTSRAARALGRDGEADAYARLADEVRDAFRKEFFTPAGRVAERTQTALVIALHMDLVPEEHRERVRADLRQLIAARGDPPRHRLPRHLLPLPHADRKRHGRPRLHAFAQRGLPELAVRGQHGRDDPSGNAGIPCSPMVWSATRA